MTDAALNPPMPRVTTPPRATASARRRPAPSPRVIAGLKVAVFVAALIPVGRLVWLAWHDALGANPIETITRSTGWWTLAFLAITLAVTPLRKLFDLPWLLRFRRMLGLFAWFHGALHLTTYLWLDQFFDWGEIARDIVKRPFITVGFAAFVLMTPLAATSANRIVRWMGAKRWLWLHRAVYAIALLGVVHFWWLVKKDVTEPAWFATVIGTLLAVRVWWKVRERAAASR